MASYNIPESVHDAMDAQSARMLLTVLLCAVIPAAYFLYRLALPRPIPGIPYNPEATKRLLGDIPNLVSEISMTNEPVAWVQKQAERLQSPIIQVFISPFSSPRVVLADFRESKDLLMRRKEFDRSSTVGALFAGLLPHHHIHQKSNAVWKSNRKLLQDLMMPQFLQQVAAPSIHKNASKLLRLWDEKCRLADGRPFSASDDIFHAALDAVLAFSFGEDFPHHGISTDVSYLSNSEAGKSESKDEPVEFPAAPLNPAIQATLDLTSSLERLQQSVVPRWSWFYMANTNLRQAIRTKNDYVRKELETAAGRLHGSDLGSGVRSAVDLMIQREKKLAEAEGRSPEFFSGTMVDETFGFVVAGHDTTSTTVLWGLKLLADHPAIQTRLRQSLQLSMASALAEKRDPAIEEITRPNNPYLDAVIEEILRCAGTVPLVDRTAMRDTVLLGHPIPKGTVVMCLGQGASLRSAAFDIDESQRNGTSRAERELGPHDIAIFEPERWLVPPSTEDSLIEGETAGAKFDGTAAPQLAFSLGKRGCFGKRLAYLELRIILTLIVWNFELLPCPQKLSSYNGNQGITKKPKQAFVRLRRVE